MSDLEKSAQEVADLKNLDLVVPGERDIFLDIDTPEDLDVYTRMAKVLKENGCYVEEIQRTVSAGGNTHIYLRYGKALTDVQRILLQACLGSDRKRETLSYIRVLRGNATPTVFFETKDDLVVRPVRRYSNEEMNAQP